MPRPSLSAIGREMREEAPVFIVGAPRSGTSLLYRILQKHPAFAGHRVSLAETHLIEHLPRLFLFRRGYPRSLVRYMLRDEGAYDRFLHAIRPVRVLNGALSPANQVLRPQWAPWWWTSVNGAAVILRSFFFYAREARGVDRIVEKTPKHWRYLHVLLHAFPRCRMLYLVRHPVDQFSSFRRRTSDEKAVWARMGVQAFCRQYSRSTTTAVRAVRDGLPLYILRYEDLTASPEETMTRAFASVGVSFVPDALEGDASIKRRRVEPLVVGPIVERTKDWREYVTESEAQAIEERLAPLMESFGYRAYASLSPRDRDA
jgi:hypothetical protein